MKEGVPSVHVGVGVAAELPAIFRLLISALPNDDALLSERTSNCTSDMLRNRRKQASPLKFSNVKMSTTKWGY